MENLPDNEVREMLAEVREHRKELDALKVKRDAVLEAMRELTALEVDVRKHAASVMAHLKAAL